MSRVAGLVAFHVVTGRMALQLLPAAVAIFMSNYELRVCEAWSGQTGQRIDAIESPERSGILSPQGVKQVSCLFLRSFQVYWGW